MSLASSALRLLGHMNGFCVDNTAKNSPVVAHDKVASVGCCFGVTAEVEDEQLRSVGQCKCDFL
jgi:hypothetical protein